MSRDDWDDNCRAKEALINEAENVADTNDFSWGHQEMKRLMAEWKSTGFAGPDDNDRLWDEFHAARQNFFDRASAARDAWENQRTNNEHAKEDLIQEAQSIARTTDWKAGGEEMKRLMIEWRATGSAGKDANDRLWERFQEARTTFFDNRTRYFERQDALRTENARAKQRLVDRAKALARSDDWKEAHESLQELRAEWKAIGPAGRDEDDRLWDDFGEACQGFYDRRKKAQEKRDAERKSNARAKEKLVARAKSLSKSEDWRETHEALQELRAEWKTIGRAEREEDDRLWAEFSDACQTFYDRRKKSQDKRDAERKVSKGKKEAIIRRAQNLVNPSNWDAAHEDMKDLMNDWKIAGSAGVEDQELWSEFNRIRKNFYEHFKAYRATRRTSRISKDERDQRDTERAIRRAFGGTTPLVDVPSPFGPKEVGKSRLAQYEEKSFDLRGKLIGNYSVGHEGYAHGTFNRHGNLRGHTTGHKSGDVHKHDSHSHGPGTDHHVDGGSPPSGKIIDEYIKSDSPYPKKPR